MRYRLTVHETQHRVLTIAKTQKHFLAHLSGSTVQFHMPDHGYIWTRRKKMKNYNYVPQWASVTVNFKWPVNHPMTSRSWTNGGFSMNPIWDAPSRPHALWRVWECKSCLVSRAQLPQAWSYLLKGVWMFATEAGSHPLSDPSALRKGKKCGSQGRRLPVTHDTHHNIIPIHFIGALRVHQAHASNNLYSLFLSSGWLESRSES